MLLSGALRTATGAYSLNIALVGGRKELFLARDPVRVGDLGLKGGDVSCPLADVGGRVAGGALDRIREAGGDQAGLTAGQLGGGRAEMSLGGGLHAIYSLAHLGYVQIDLHYPLLVPHQLDKDGEISLETLAYH